MPGGVRPWDARAMRAPIDEYVRTLDRALTGPGRLKGDMLRGQESVRKCELVIAKM